MTTLLEPSPIWTGPKHLRKPVAIPAPVWRISVIVVFGAFICQFDSFIVNIGLATIADDLHATLRTTQWIVSGYLVGLAVGLPLCAWSCRRWGAGRVWLAALAGFTCSSALCALSPTAETLIVSRCLQGFSGGLLLPAGQTIIAAAAGKAAMGRVMSIVGTSLVLAPALGPIVGSWVLRHLSWPWLFAVNVPIGVAAFVCGCAIIPLGERGRPPRFDGTGFVLIGVALPLIAYGISRLGRTSAVLSSSTYANVLIGASLLMVFAMRSTGTRRLIDLAPLANVRFRSAAVTTLLTGITEFGALVAWPLFLQIDSGFGLVKSGLTMLGFAGGSLFLIVSGQLTDGYGGGAVCVSGCALMTVSLMPPALGVGDGSVVMIEVALVLFGVGVSLSVVPAFTAAFVSVKPDQMSDAVTIVNILLRVGGVLGSALAVAVIGAQSLHGRPEASRFHAAFAVLSAISALAIVSSAWMARAAAAATRSEKV